jgi:beta-propeller repeat-containing protein/centrosomal CEP192-like protein
LRRLLAGLLLATLSYAPAAGAAVRPASTRLASASPEPGRAAQEYGKLPLSFERNEGQADPQAKFLARGQGYIIFLTPNEAVLALRRTAQKVPAVLHLEVLGRNLASEVSGLDELPGKGNYFIGNDPDKWRTNVPRYARVRCADVYPGIGLIYYGKQRQLEYDFVIAPGASPKVIRLGIGGAKKIEINAQGDLVLRAGKDRVVLHKPVAYQETRLDGLRATVGGVSKQFIDARYVLKSGNRIGFEVAAYDPAKPLVIDPVLSYSTYLGGSDADSAYGIAVDSSGNAYVTGSTLSANFPTATPLQSASGGDSDAFVAKLNAAGSALVYATYLGGSGFDKGTGIAVDASGNAYVTGYTTSVNFPTMKAFQTTYGGNTDAFVTKLDPAGSALVYSSYFGGSEADFGQGIALDSSGNAFLTGSTQSTNFPTASPLQSSLDKGSCTTPPCPSDAFVAKLKADGSALVYSTYLGGSGADSSQGIAVDASGNAYVTGYTLSTNFPTASPFQASNGGGSDAFVAKLNPAGSALLYSTYLGGSGLDRGFAIAIDSSGNAYVTGDTDSTNFPVTAGVLQGINSGNGDAFVAKLNPAGSALVYSTFLGGSDVEQGTGIAVDGAGNAHVIGFTKSSNFPVADSFQPTFGGVFDAFVSKLNVGGTALLYSTYLGGNAADFGQAIALDSSGNAYVAGSTASPNFPPVAGAVQATFGGSSDAFVAKIIAADAPGLAVSPQQIAFGNEGTGVSTAAQSVTLTSVGSLPLSITGITVSANFTLVAAGTTCSTSTSLAPGASCIINVAFSPTALGALTGSVTIADNAAGSPHHVALTGTGVKPAPAVTLSTTSLTFGSQTVGTTSPPQPVTLTNSGTATLTLTKFAISGDFLVQGNNCGASQTTTTNLSPGASCVFQIVFKPSGASSASRTGVLSFTDNATGSPQNVTLTGTGVAVFSLSATYTSSKITIGTATTKFTVSASAPSAFTGSITLACASASGATCTFNPTSIKPGQTSALTVGSLSASTPNPLTFTVNGTNGSQTAPLSLTIIMADFSVSASPALALTTRGQSATYMVSVTPSNGFNQAVNLSCFTPLPQGVTCSFSPGTVTPNGSAAINTTLTVATTKQSVLGPRASPHPIFPPGTRGMPWLLWLLAFGTVGTVAAWRRSPHPERHNRRQIPLNRLALGIVILFVAMWAGCNEYGVGPIATGGIPGTAPGNYIVTITGTLKSSSASSSSSSSSSSPSPPSPCTPTSHCTSVNLSVG